MPTLAKLAAAIRNGKDYEAEEAVQRLARNKSEEATKLLIKALGHDSEHVSGAALDAAEKRPGEKLSRAIARAALRWKRTNLSSIRILKARGDDVSWAALIKIAKMADHKGRPFALKAVEKRCKRDIAFRSRRDVAKLMGIDVSGGANGKKKAKKAPTKKTSKKKKAAVKAGGQPLTEIPRNQAQAIQVIETLRRSRSPKALDGLEAALEHKSLDARWAAVLGIGAKSGKRPTTILVRVARTDRS